MMISFVRLDSAAIFAICSATFWRRCKSSEARLITKPATVNTTAITPDLVSRFFLSDKLVVSSCVIPQIEETVAKQRPRYLSIVSVIKYSHGKLTSITWYRCLKTSPRLLVIKGPLRSDIDL